MNPEKQQELSNSVTEIYLAIEEEILINFARQLKKRKRLLKQDSIEKWAEYQLSQLEALSQQNIITIAKYSGLAIDEITKLLQEIGYAAVNQVDKDLQEAVRQGAIIKPPTEPRSTIQPILLSYQQQAIDKFNMVNTTMLEQSKQQYKDVLNKTVGKVLTGTITPQKALRETVSEWAEDGVPALIDKANKEWTPEAYINTVVRSISNRVSNTIQDNRMDEYGVDLIEVSAHMGARPLCAPYQGKIYSRSGKSKKYPPFSETSYGKHIAALFGINCGHVKYPFIEGVSVKREIEINKEENDEAYKLSQQQRYLERQIRHAKKQLNVLSAMGDDVGVQMAKQKVRERQANMRRFIDETGRTRRRNREQLAYNNPRV
ncbi:phage minor capsid protein [Niallia sp. FSL W8-0177]|uniref:phage minor capsid protein n=1 Tax=Niallia TaxID=2837506 RepID=UPI002E1B8057|nr:phage minor capsid protein [Niallia circulans]